MKPAIPTESGITESKNTIDRLLIYANIIDAPAPQMGARSSFVFTGLNVKIFNFKTKEMSHVSFRTVNSRKTVPNAKFAETHRKVENPSRRSFTH